MGIQDLADLRGLHNRPKAGEVRRVRVTAVCDTLVLLMGREIERSHDRAWNCENIRTGRQMIVDERHMSEKTYNEMEVLAWVSK